MEAILAEIDRRDFTQRQLVDVPLVITEKLPVPASVRLKEHP